MNLQHTCMQTYRVGILHTKWLGAQFKKKVESNPRIKIKELQAKAHKKWNVTVTKSMAAKSKQEALSQIQGTFKEQYKRINDYCTELLRAHPALDEVIPGIDNRYCVRHLYNNFRKKFPGLELKNQMWRCTRKKLEKKAKYARDWRPFLSAASKYEDAYLRCYQEVIHPLNGPELWERSQYDDVMPPPYMRPSHRPVKKRKRGPGDEDNRSQTHISRRGQTHRCSNCGALGHKKPGCIKPNKKVCGSLL
ncbi:hypothetical protein Ahy_A06g029633 [Arachis hypogaea]|uniref:CCHC-type domain-containing protein n=1 Tax=Arachis hypogaea TaxID=3818 RepID=A0A445CTY1_ARAHY|nr:hypothetical protein Ahy_A06g029633 [Arachis hypogaea]